MTRFVGWPLPPVSLNGVVGVEHQLGAVDLDHDAALVEGQTLGQRILERKGVLGVLSHVRNSGGELEVQRVADLRVGVAGALDLLVDRGVGALELDGVLSLHHVCKDRIGAAAGGRAARRRNDVVAEREALERRDVVVAALLGNRGLGGVKLLLLRPIGRLLAEGQPQRPRRPSSW